MGLNAVDNTRMWFDHVRIPASHTLEQIGRITNSKYDGWIKDKNTRLAAALGELVSARTAISIMSNSASKLGLTIAIRYALQRRQFGLKPGSEIPIIDHLYHQRRLFPLLAKTYALVNIL
jgi:acyl-CoA oxidase